MRTQFFRSCLGLAFLVSLWPNAAAADGGILILAGEGALALQPSVISSIQLDLGALAGPICRPDDPVEDGDCKVKCKVRVTNGPGGGPTELLPNLAYLLPEPVTTPCGLWSAEMTLDPALVVPGALALTQAPGDPGHGVFAGTIEINSSFRLKNLDTGEEKDLVLPLAFSLSGLWGLASPGEAPTSSNLYFPTYDANGKDVTFEYCIPKSFRRANEYEVLEGDCEPCTEEEFMVTPTNDEPDGDPSIVP